MNLKNGCGTSTKRRLPHRLCWSVVPVVPKLSSLPFDPLFSVFCVDCSLFVCIFDVSSTSFNYVLALTLVFSIQFEGIFHHKFFILFNSLLFQNNCLAFVFIVGFPCLWFYILSLLLLNDFLGLWCLTFQFLLIKCWIWVRNQATMILSHTENANFLVWKHSCYIIVLLEWWK